MAQGLEQAAACTCTAAGTGSTSKCASTPEGGVCLDLLLRAWFDVGEKCQGLGRRALVSS
jgi:hypothetical protein